MAAAKPTPELIATVAAYVRSGAFPAVAAAAAGLPAARHEAWMQRGDKAKAAAAFRDYRAAVLLAAAQARVAAEMAVLSDKPDLWLTKGPGKDRADSPGWSGVVKPLVQVDNRSVNLLADPTSAALLQLLLAALAPFPEARRAALAALNGDPTPPRLPARVVEATVEVEDRAGGV